MAENSWNAKDSSGLLKDQYSAAWTILNGLVFRKPESN